MTGGWGTLRRAALLGRRRQEGDGDQLVVLQQDARVAVRVASVLEAVRSRRLGTPLAFWSTPFWGGSAGDAQVIT